MPAPCTCGADGSRCLRPLAGITEHALELACPCWCHPCECTLDVLCALHHAQPLDDCCDYHTIGGSVALSCLSATQLRSLPETPENATMHDALRRFTTWRASL